jgi:hypothetical protein
MTDFGEGKFVVGRKSHRCDGCLGPIPKGESHYNFRGMYDGEWQNWRMHEECHDDFYRNNDEPEFNPGDFEMPDRVSAIATAMRAKCD